MVSSNVVVRGRGVGGSTTTNVFEEELSYTSPFLLLNYNFLDIFAHVYKERLIFHLLHLLFDTVYSFIGCGKKCPLVS
jgi:hypothetical protein